jgi:hypothetical protein
MVRLSVVDVINTTKTVFILYPNEILSWFLLTRFKNSEIMVKVGSDLLFCYLVCVITPCDDLLLFLNFLPRTLLAKSTVWYYNPYL